MADTMTIDRDEALALICHAGWKNGAKWDNTRLASKLAQLPDVLMAGADEPEDKDVAKSLAAVLKHVSGGGTMEVVDAEKSEDASEAVAPSKPAKAPATSKAKKEKAKPATDESVEPEADLEPAPKPSAKKSKPAAKPAKTPRAEKVTRWAFAAMLLKKHGLDVEINEALVSKLDSAYGKVNPRESKVCLAGAQKILRSYVGGDVDAKSLHSICGAVCKRFGSKANTEKGHAYFEKLRGEAASCMAEYIGFALLVTAAYDKE
jgi:hypothetical protein